MKNTSNLKEKITSILFITILMVVSFLNMVFPTKAEISEAENRALASMPVFSKEDLFSGVYFQEIDSYYSDHFFQRESIINFSASINEYKGIRGKDNVQLITTVNRDEFNMTNESTLVSNEMTSGANDIESSVAVIEKTIYNRSDLSQEEKLHITTSSDLNMKIRRLAKKELDYYISLEPVEFVELTEEEALSQMTITEEPDVNGSIQNRLLVVNDEAFEIFGYSEASCTYYADAISGFADQFDTDIKTYSIVVPSHIEFLASEKYRSMAESQAEATNFINSQFSDKISPVNIYNALAEHAEEYIYFRSDHHWTAKGAYYAYTAFANKIGDKPYDLEDYEYESIDGFLGTLYNKTKNSTIGANPDTVEIFHPIFESDFTIYTENGVITNYDVINMGWKNSGNKYMVFISGDQPFCVIDSEVDNGRKIMVFKDSYGNAFIPYLISHYDEIYIIDPRHYTKGAVSLAKENGIDEFLFINSAVVIAGNTNFATNIYKVSY